MTTLYDQLESVIHKIQDNHGRDELKVMEDMNNKIGNDNTEVEKNMENE